MKTSYVRNTTPPTTTHGIPPQAPTPRGPTGTALALLPATMAGLPWPAAPWRAAAAPRGARLRERKTGIRQPPRCLALARPPWSSTHKASNQSTWVNSYLTMHLITWLVIRLTRQASHLRPASLLASARRSCGARRSLPQTPTPAHLRSTCIPFSAEPTEILQFQHRFRCAVLPA